MVARVSGETRVLRACKRTLNGGGELKSCRVWLRTCWELRKMHRLSWQTKVSYTGQTCVD